MTTRSEAFEKLVDYAVRARKNAAGLPSQEDILEYWSGVGFTLGGNRFVLPMSEVGEILSVPRYTQVPGVQPWVKGIANVRGRLLPIMDLMAFINKVSAFQPRRRRLLVLEQGDLYSGLVVDEVMGMQHFLADTFSDMIPAEYTSVASYLRGSYRNDAGVWALFSMKRLAQDPRFLNVAS